MSEQGRKGLSRRWWVAGAGVTGLAGAAYSIYQAAPSFWRQYRSEMQRLIRPPQHVPDPGRWSGKGMHLAWLGHSTVLLKVDGFTILTDPVFSERAGLNFGPVTLGLKRLVAPALSLEKLPRVDLIVLSHAHMDHFDIPSLRALESRRTEVITAWGTTDLLRPERYRSVRELRWGEEATAGGVKLRGQQVNHWGARMRSDTWRGYCGYVIEAGRYRILFGGDTADTHYFSGLASARGFDLAVMPIGAYNPWIRYHCTPEQAWRMANEARAHYFLPVHHRTFALGREPEREPVERLFNAAGARHERIVLQAIGQEFHLS